MALNIAVSTAVHLSVCCQQNNVLLSVDFPEIWEIDILWTSPQTSWLNRGTFGARVGLG